MTKLYSIGLAILVATTITGCELYFGDSDDDSWSYCAADGYYVDGQWVSPTCPGGGNACNTDDDCASGCFCNESAGVCEEAGYCSQDSDCPSGYHCDSRSSCVPNEQPTCQADADCPAGSDCVGGYCQTSCACTNDEEAIAQGYHHCDESRQTCEMIDDAGTCNFDVTCNINPPNCPAGSVALILNGCYTGQCSTIAQCDLTPRCSAMQHEADCLPRTGPTGDCDVNYLGINCRDPLGGSCTAGTANCTCESFRYASCVAK